MISAVQSTAAGSTCQSGNMAASCSTVVVLLTPALTIVKSTGATNATLGSTVPYSIVVTNTGQTVYSAAAFTDDLSGLLDDATVGAPTLVGPGSVGSTGGVLSWSGALDPGGSATITFSATINSPSTGDRTMSDRAVSTTPGNNCVAGSSDSRCISSVAVTNAVTLTFTKTADVLYTVAGGTVNYTVTVQNASGSSHHRERSTPTRWATSWTTRPIPGMPPLLPAR